MTILTFSDQLLRVAQQDFSLLSLTAHSPQSAFNGTSFTSGPISEFWSLDMTITPGDEDHWRALRALLTSLRGGRNLLRIYDKSSYEKRGTGGGPIVNVAVAGAAGDEQISLKNLTASQAVALAADDKIGIGENLHTVISDSGSDADGRLTVSILPALRRGIAVDDPINLLRPTGLFRLMSKPSLVIVPGMINQPVQLEFMEDPDLG